MKSKAKPKPQPSKNKRPIVAPQPQRYSYERIALGNPTYFERRTPLKRVPGMRNANWSAEIGRWVVRRVASV